MLAALDVVESDAYVTLVAALQDPLADVHKRSAAATASAEQAIAARIASLRALATSSPAGPMA